MSWKRERVPQPLAQLLLEATEDSLPQYDVDAPWGEPSVKSQLNHSAAARIILTLPQTTPWW